MSKEIEISSKYVAGFIIMLFVMFYAFAGYTRIIPGEVAVITKNIGEPRGMQDKPLPLGITWKDPFVYDVDVYDAKIKKYELLDVPGQSSDGQPIEIDLSLEIGLSGKGVPSLHEEVGKDWYEQLVYPKIRASMRNSGAAAYSSEEIYTSEARLGIENSLNEVMKSHLSKYGIICSINLRDIKFTNAEFVATLERKARAAQNVIIAERQAEQAEHEAIKVANHAEGEKQKAIKEAEAVREKLRLLGEGERLQKEETAKGNLAIYEAEAEGTRLQVEAYGTGETYANVKWAENLGPNVKVLGYPLGAPGTTGLFDGDGVLGRALGGNKMIGAGSMMTQ